MTLNGLNIPDDRIADFCRKHSIVRLLLFGSVLGDRFSAQSDVDVLVEFAPTTTPGLFGFAGMQMELSTLLGRRAHLHTPAMLGPDYREIVARGARVQYAA